MSVIHNAEDINSLSDMIEFATALRYWCSGNEGSHRVRIDLPELLRFETVLLFRWASGEIKEAPELWFLPEPCPTCPGKEDPLAFRCAFHLIGKKYEGFGKDDYTFYCDNFAEGYGETHVRDLRPSFKRTFISHLLIDRKGEKGK